MFERQICAKHERVDDVWPRAARRTVWDDAGANVRGSGDPETLAGGVETGIALRADDRGADAGIAGAAQTAHRPVGGAHAIRAGCAITGAERREDAGAVLAGSDDARVGGDAIGIDQTFDRRAAVARMANLTGGTIGIAATIAGYAAHPAGAPGATDRALIADVLPAESGIAAHITGAGFDSALVDTAAAPFASRDADIVRRVGAATALIGGATEIFDRSGTEEIDRAAEIFAITMPGATTVVAAFGIARISRIEMRMATMIAAELATFDHGGIGGHVAATVCRRAHPATDGILTANLAVRIETPAIGFDQRRNADPVLNGNGLFGGLCGYAELAWLLQADGRLRFCCFGHRSSQRPFGSAAGGEHRHPGAQ